MDATAAIFSPGDSSNGRYYIDNNSRRDEFLQKDNSSFKPNMFSPTQTSKVTFEINQSQATPIMQKPSIKDQPIWKTFIYDPNTGIYLIKKDKVDQFLQNKTYLKIGEKANCKINVHDSDESSNGNVFFSVTGTYEARSNALEMLRNETGRLGVIVNLPLTSPENQGGMQKGRSMGVGRKPSLAKSSTTQITKTFTPAYSGDSYYANTSASFVYSNNDLRSNKKLPQSIMKRTKSYTAKFEPTLSAPVDYNNNNMSSFAEYSFHNNEFDYNNFASVQMRSSTVNNNNNNNQQFAPYKSYSSKQLNRHSVVQFKPDTFNNENASTQKLNRHSLYINGNDFSQYDFQRPSFNFNIPKSATIGNIKSDITERRPARRYTFKFLLERANSDESKQIPENWPELNAKYPNICFCGRVISYFNPDKYETFWNRTKQLNQNIHVA